MEPTRPKSFHLLNLLSLKSKKPKYFKVYKDEDVIPGISQVLTAKGEEAFVPANQDDDLESDEDIVKSGIKTSMRDMLIVRDALKRYKPERLQEKLKNFRKHAPMFGGVLPLDKK